MPTPDTLPLRWFIFRPTEGGSPLGSFSRTEAEALADVQQRTQRSNKRAKRTNETPSTLPLTFTRDTNAETRANAALLSPAKAAT